MAVVTPPRPHSPPGSLPPVSTAAHRTAPPRPVPATRCIASPRRTSSTSAAISRRRDSIPAHTVGAVRKWRAWLSVLGESLGAEYDVGKSSDGHRSLWPSAGAGALPAAPSPGRRGDVSAGSDDAMSTPESTCWTVIRGAAAGRPSDREELARRYLGVVRAYLAARWGGSALRDDLDDAAQEVF